jgi:IS5 family transposase
MAEVGLVKLAKTALKVTKAVLPERRSRFSKKQFNQPQLLALLCVMRFEDWTYREAEVRLAEHQELRRALELESVPDHTTVYRFLRRLKEEDLAKALAEVVKRFPRYKGRRSMVAMDATGLTFGAISSYFLQRKAHHSQKTRKPLTYYWLKWLVVVDVSRHLLLAQAAHAGPTNDCCRLPELIDQARQVAPVQVVLADAEFDSERNHQHVRQIVGAQSVIPPKRSRPEWKIKGFRALMRQDFPQNLYRQRVQVESIFSAIKRKLSARAPGRSLFTQRLQALLLGLTFNLYRL